MAVPTRQPLFAALAGLLACSCGGMVGPVVTDVRWGPSGDLVVTRCMLAVSAAGGVTTYNMKSCKRTTQPPPGPKSEPSPEVPVAPPVGSSTTIVP